MASHKEVVMHQTWGHLFPQEQCKHKATIRVAQSAYTGLHLLDHDSKFADSPWFCAALGEFMFNLPDLEPGEVKDIPVTIQVVTKIKRIYWMEEVLTYDLMPEVYDIIEIKEEE